MLLAGSSTPLTAGLGPGGGVKALVDASVKNPSFFTCSLIVNCNYTKIKPGDNQTVITNYTHKF